MEIDKLFDLRETKFIKDDEREVIDLLLQAVNDWPNPVDTVENFLIKVKKFLKTDRLNYETINVRMKGLTPEANLWELESLSSLLELMGTKKNIDLETILHGYNVIEHEKQ